MYAKHGVQYQNVVAADEWENESRMSAAKQSQRFNYGSAAHNREASLNNYDNGYYKQMRTAKRSNEDIKDKFASSLRPMSEKSTDDNSSNMARSLLDSSKKERELVLSAINVNYE